jgi:ribosomal protein S18 acetylase RimI-like enzyme
MTIEVRRAGVEDWRRVKALRLAALGDAPDAFGTTHAEDAARPDEGWQDRLRSGAVTLVAVADGRDAGLCVVSRSHDDPAVAGLYSMWVAPWARGRGVGDALIEAALRAARERGWSRIVLEVGDNNLPAIALYERWGFAPTGRTGTLPPPRQHVTEHERGRGT